MRLGGPLCPCRLGLLSRRAWKLAEAGEEESLVDSTVEDRDAQLEALADHVSPLQAGLTCQLGGRQVICHKSASSFSAYIYIV
jgi:hypothetical protein